MPFSANGSVVSTDLNNMLRGLYRDNSDHAVTGTTNETDMGSVSITANSIGATGGLHAHAAGSITGTAGNRTIRIYFGGSSFGTFVINAANNDNWIVDIWIYNTATNAQRIMVRFVNANPSTGVVDNHYASYTTSSKDTTSNQTLKLTGQLANSGDTLTQSIFDVYVVQIT